MSSKASRASKTVVPHEKTLKKQDIPVQITDLSVFDDHFAVLREKFLVEMRRVEDEMISFSKNLAKFYNLPVAMAAGMTTSRNDSQEDWVDIANSPLVHGEGESKTLKLQFDVSQFLPAEVHVKIHNNVLTVSAVHEEKSSHAVTSKRYTREFQLPPATNTEAVVSSISRDGVLVVQIPLPPLPIATSPVQKAN